jgi:hypothetical protein
MSEHKFVENLETYGLGDLLEQMVDEQKKIVSAVRQTAKKGKLTLTLDFIRRGNNDIEVKADIKSKIPRTGLLSVIMFADDANDLHEENPDQLVFDPKNVHKIDKGEEKQTVNKP